MCRCEAEGDPAPGLGWSREEAGLPRHGSWHSTTLLPGTASLLSLANLSLARAGRYACTASNPAGRAAATTAVGRLNTNYSIVVIHFNEMSEYLRDTGC